MDELTKKNILVIKELLLFQTRCGFQGIHIAKKMIHPEVLKEIKG